MIRTRLQGDTPFFPNMLNNGKVEVCLKEDVDKVIAELKEERRWRRFPDEKPEDEGNYLVMARYPDDYESHIEICFYDRNGEDFGHYERRYAGSGDFFGGFDGEEWITHNVSFWMPLPSAPKEVNLRCL